MLNAFRLSFLALIASAAVAVGGPTAAPVRLATISAGHSAEAQPKTWLLHLPGIAGKRWCDDQYALGLNEGGFTGAIEIYDWTGDDAGLTALLAYKKNQAEAQKVADYLTDRIRRQPSQHVILTGHSGGTGIAVWALEKLPDDVKIDQLVFLASALSPGYDLTKALSHVRGKCYSFCSENDVLVLGAGTKMFGTIDGRKTEAAGELGFVFPPAADEKQYEKLVQKPYDKTWMQYRNVGDHMGCMARPFTRAVIGPLLVGVESSTPVASSQMPAKGK